MSDDAKKPAKMSPKERVFVDEYLVDLNATAAAERAGYTSRQKSLNVLAHRIMRKPAVAEAIEERMKSRASRLRITADRVLDEAAVIAFSCISDYQVIDGNLCPAPHARHDVMRAVSSLKKKQRSYTDKQTGETVVETEIEFKLWNKPEVLKLVGQHVNVLVPKVEIEAKGVGGVLAVPVPIDSAQWGALAHAQQAKLLDRSPVAVIPPPDDPKAA